MQLSQIFKLYLTALYLKVDTFRNNLYEPFIDSPEICIVRIRPL